MLISYDACFYDIIKNFILYDQFILTAKTKMFYEWYCNKISLLEGVFWHMNIMLNNCRFMDHDPDLLTMSHII